MEIKEFLENWNKATSEHMNDMEEVIDNRNSLRNIMIEHLSRFFEWDDIRFNRDFTRIRLFWKHDCHPIIKVDLIKDLGMDFVIDCNHSAKLGTGVVIELYPTSLPKDLDEKTIWEED